MVPDEFEMENQGYEEEPSTCPAQRIERKFFELSSSVKENPRLSPICQSIVSTTNGNSSRNNLENHVYEDIAISADSINSIPVNGSSRLPHNFANNNNNNNKNNNNNDVCQQWEISNCSNNSQLDNKNVRNVSNCQIENATNFHRNLTLPLRRAIGNCENNENDARFSVRVTNRERTRFSVNDSTTIHDDSSIIITTGRTNHDRPDEEDIFSRGTTTSHIVDKPGRRRRKKDCKHCKSKANVLGTFDNSDIRENISNLRQPIESTKDRSTSLDLSGSVIQSNNESNEIELIRSNLQTSFPLNDSNFTIYNTQNFDSTNTGVRKNSIFSISNNVSSIFGPNCPKSLNYDKNETDVRLVSVELTDDRALITPQKNRTGMKVNSIYSQEHWRNKDVPIFVTDVKEQNFQRAYSLPTRTQTPSSQNRVNLRRSVRGEPPPHPARLRKNRHGWTLHFARPLDGTGCTRSIVLLLIAILALLGIGGIALYIVFEPEKLQIIQQYLRSSGPNVTRESNNSLTFVADSLNREANIEITTLPPPSVTLIDSLGEFSQDTTLATETETDIAITSTSIAIDRNVTRHCDDCFEDEVCVALVDEEVPICRKGPDPLDPTGCNGLCLINKQKCHRLDFDAFRCDEVEHYCLDDEWTCSNTLCIPLVKHCDGHMNCYDHSDEYDCDCDLETHFQCGNETSCLPLERRCDGKIDCWDATDEINCTLGQDFGWSCPSSSEFTCSNGECILNARFCDGLRDCTDGSDEPHGCQGRCNKHEFSCLNSRCITKAMKCNGIDDCGDESDEQHCRDRIFKKLAT